MSTLSADLLVVGGGVLGLTCALRQLELAPSSRVLVLDQGSIGSGATSYAGAMDVPYFQSPLHRELVQESWSWYERCADASSFRHAVPLSWFVSSERQQRELRERLLFGTEARPAQGAGVWAEPAQLSVVESRGYVIDPLPWCRDLSRRIAAAPNGSVLENACVKALEASHGEIQARLADGTHVVAARALVCVGPWLQRFSRATAQLAAQRGIRNKTVCGLRVRLDAAHRAWRAVSWLDKGAFLLPFAEPGLYAMSIRHEAWDREPGEQLRLPSDVAKRAAELLDVVVGPGRWQIARECVFLDTYAPDEIGADFSPVVAPLEGLANLAVAVSGAHGSGVRLAPGLASWALKELYQA